MMSRWAPLTIRGVLLVILAVAAAGCWSRQEVNGVALVSAVALDRAAGGQVEVTIQVLKPKSLGIEQGRGGAQSAAFLVSATGATVFEAIRHLNHYVPRKPEWRHNNVIIFSEELARAGLGDVLDFFLRDHESRLDQWILVARGERAADALQMSWEVDPNTGLAARRVYQASAQFTGEAVGAQLYQFAMALESPAAAPVAAIIEPFRPGEVRIGVETRAENQWRTGGAAVFHKDRLAGFLSDREARGLNWLRGTVHGAIVRIPCEQQPGAGIGMEILGSRARLVPQWPGGSLPTVRAEIRVKAKLGDIMCQDDLTKPEMISRLERRAEVVIAAEAESAVRRLQLELGADPIGAGEALHRAYPRDWPRWKSRWDQLFPTIRIDPAVVVELTQIGTAAPKPVPRQAPSERTERGGED